MHISYFGVTCSLANQGRESIRGIYNIFMPKTLNFLSLFWSLRLRFIFKPTFNKDMAKTCLKYNYLY